MLSKVLPPAAGLVGRRALLAARRTPAVRSYLESARLASAWSGTASSSAPVLSGVHLPSLLWSAAGSGPTGSEGGPTTEGSSSSSSGPTQKEESDRADEKQQKGSKPPNNEEPNWNIVFAGAFIAAVLSYGSFQNEPVKEITIQELLREYVAKGAVEKIQIVNRSKCRVFIREGMSEFFGVSSAGHLVIQLGSVDAFEAKLDQVQYAMGIEGPDRIPVQYVHEVDYQSMLLNYGPSLMLFVSLLLAARGMMNGNPMGGLPGRGGMGGAMGGGSGKGRNMFNMGKAFADGKGAVKSEVRFADVAGQEQAKREVVEFVDFLKNTEKYSKLGARIPKGGLLVGPPGTGKTLLAKAVAGEADCPFYAMSGSDFVEMYGGVGAARVRDLFKTARETAPSIIFIDEIDAIGRKRSSGGMGGNEEREGTLNQMLVEMDGFQPSTGVVVLAGTNRSDILDQALLRPGRFDRQIAVDKPDLNEREAIVKVHLKPVKLNKQLDADSVAKRLATLTPGFVGADIANICNEAAINAARRQAEAVEMEDFERATERVMAGLPKTSSIMDLEQRRTVALHESGHAVAGWFLENADPLLKVSIMPRSSGALGFAQYLPNDIALFTKQAILDKMAMSLGGRAAEEIFVGRISTGASDDLDKVTKMAYSMVSVYGMNPEIGLLSYGQNQNDSQFYKPYSEATGKVMDREARQVVDSEYQRVKALLESKSSIVKALADALLAKETLVYSDLTEILGERPFAIQEQYAQYLAKSGNPFTAPFEQSGERQEPQEQEGLDGAPIAAFTGRGECAE